MATTLTIPDFPTLLNNVINSLAANTVITENGVVVQPSFNVGSLHLTFAEVLALNLSLAYDQLYAVYLACFVATATGTDLDNLGQLVGNPRQPAIDAQAAATFSSKVAEAGDVAIQPGTVVLAYDTSGNPTIGYSVQTLATILTGTTSITATVTAVVAGAASTVAGMTTALMQTPQAGVDTVVLAPLGTAVPGQDAESDSAYRTRLLSSSLVNRSSTSYIISQIAAIAGVKAAYVLTDSSGNITDGAGQVGFLVQNSVAGAFPAATQTLINNAISSLKSSGVSLVPIGGSTPGWAQLTPTAAAVTITVKVNNAANAPAAQTATNTAISGYLSKLAMGAAIVYDALVSLALGVANVIDVTSLSIVYNSTTYTANVPVLPNAVASAGTITVNWTT